MVDTVHTTGRNRVLHIQPGSVCRTYGTRLLFDGKTSLHYETEVSIRPGDEDFIFYIDRKQVYINDRAPDLLIDKMADDLGKLLYPVMLYVDRDGFITGIANTAAIETRWNNRKDYLSRYYTGPIAEAALQETEQVIMDPDRMMRALQNDWFLMLFCSGLYDLQPYDFRQPAPIQLPLTPYAPLATYAATREITEQHTENKSFTVICKGPLAEGSSYPQQQGEMYLNYDLYHKDFAISAITGHARIQTDGLPGKEVGIELFHLREKDKPVDEVWLHYNEQGL